MIVFLNFAPIRFMGGAERWMIDTAKEVNTYEHTMLISVVENLASLYGRVVLGRPFVRRISIKEEKQLPPNLSLTLRHFIPLSQEWYSARRIFNQARLIYMRFEVSELIILFYFAGFSALKKTVAGIHSPLKYNSPISFFDHLHAALYESRITRYILSQMKYVHVVSRNDREFIEKNFRLTHVQYIPNGIDMTGIEMGESQKDGKLHIIFVGELSRRKGAEILSEMIHDLPSTMTLDVAGEGPLLSNVQESALHKPNVTIHGYLPNEKIRSLYRKTDVFFLPSRSEGLSLAMLEALAHGLMIVNSKDISLGAPFWVERSVERREYMETLKDISNEKNIQKNKKKIRLYCSEHYSIKRIYEKLKTSIFTA